MNIRSKMLYMLLAGGMASSLCMASVEDENTAPPVNVPPAAKDEPKKEDKKEEGISTERKIIGYGLLAFLLVWMFVCSGKNKLQQEEVSEDTAEGDGKEASGDSSDFPKN